MIPTVDEQLVLEVLRRVEVLAGWFLAVTPTLEKSTTKILITCKKRYSCKGAIFHLTIENIMFESIKLNRLYLTHARKMKKIRATRPR